MDNSTIQGMKKKGDIDNITIKKSQYFNELDNETIQCTLCPRNCRIKQDKTGFCKVRKNIEGQLYQLNYGIL